MCEVSQDRQSQFKQLLELASSLVKAQDAIERSNKDLELKLALESLQQIDWSLKPLALKFDKAIIPLDQAMEISLIAPKGTELFYWYGERFDRRVDYYKYFFNYLQVWLPNHGWFPVPDHLAENTISMSELRTAIDNFSKIGNTHE